MRRSIGAVLGGYLVFVVAAVALTALTGRDPHAPASARFIIGSTLYGTGFAALAGLVAARLAGGRPVFHAAVIATVISLGAIVSIATHAPHTPNWSQVTTLVVMAPAALLGGIVVGWRRPAA